jgi:hypothetical protein
MSLAPDLVSIDLYNPTQSQRIWIREWLRVSKTRDYIIGRVICWVNSFIISNKRVLRGAMEIVMHRKVQERFKRRPFRSPQGNSVPLWERKTLWFHEVYQVFRAALFFFAAIRFPIFFMKLPVLTVRLFNPVAPSLIVLTFMTGE